jgi:hypothetical protein
VRFGSEGLAVLREETQSDAQVGHALGYREHVGLHLGDEFGVPPSTSAAEAQAAGPEPPTPVTAHVAA